MAYFQCGGGSGHNSINDAVINTCGSVYGYLPKTVSNANIQIDYSKDFEVKIRYMPLGNLTATFAVLGTGRSNTYYSNPTLELQSNGSVWGGISSNNSSWTTIVQATASGPLLTMGVLYDVMLKFVKNTKTFSVKIIKVSDGTILLDVSTVVDVTPYAPNFSDTPICFGGNARNSRFVTNEYMAYDWAHSHYVNDGELIWGNLD